MPLLVAVAVVILLFVVVVAALALRAVEASSLSDSKCGTEVRVCYEAILMAQGSTWKLKMTLVCGLLLVARVSKKYVVIRLIKNIIVLLLR